MKINYHKISVTSNDIDDKCKQFIHNLETDYCEFKKDLKRYEKEFSKYKDKLNKSNVKIDLIPENVLIKSPMTIFDAPWGTGKTYFLENTCRLIANDEIKLSTIKRIILIDVFRFATCENILDELISELFLKISDNKKQKFKNMLVPLKYFYNVFARPWLNKITCAELKEIEEKCLTQEDSINQLNSNVNETTLVILDNIERIGKLSWEIIRSIQKLTLLDNFIFLLPMNKEVLNS